MAQKNHTQGKHTTHPFPNHQDLLQNNPPSPPGHHPPLAKRRSTFLARPRSQGGDAEAVLRVGKASNGLGLIVNASREVIFSADPASTARRMHGQLMPNS
ncbi:MAG UNVERIFIED_CONTAM: hypothetical protein LVT10_27720 [Anaerolineae bacterium]